MNNWINCTEIEEILLKEIPIPYLSQSDISLTYRLAMGSGDDINWRKVNEAIIKRWSKSGLLRVKELAWKL